MKKERLIWGSAIALPFLFAGFVAWGLPRFLPVNPELSQPTAITEKQTATEKRLPHAALNLDPPTQLKKYTLTGMDGKPFSFDQYRDRWVWVFFGYTFCPDICPITLGWLTQELSKASKDQTQNIQVVFVSVDPKRDTPQRIGEYLKHYDASIVGATGSAEELTRLTNDFQAGPIEFVKPKKPGGSYWINHSSLVYVISPDGKLTAAYAPQGENGDMVQDFITAKK